MHKKVTGLVFGILLNSLCFLSAEISDQAKFLASLSLGVSSACEGHYALNNADSKASAVSALVASVIRFGHDSVCFGSRLKEDKQEFFDVALVLLSSGEIVDALLKLRKAYAVADIENKPQQEDVQLDATDCKSDEQSAFFLTKALRVWVLPFFEIVATYGSLDFNGDYFRSTRSKAALIRVMSKMLQAKNWSKRQLFYAVLCVACIGYGIWASNKDENEASRRESENRRRFWEEWDRENARQEGERRERWSRWEREQEDRRRRERQEYEERRRRGAGNNRQRDNFYENFGGNFNRDRFNEEEQRVPVNSNGMSEDEARRHLCRNMVI